LTTTVPAPWCRSIAEELHRIAYDLGNVVNVEGGLPEPGYVQLHIQPAGDEAQQIAAIDDLGNAVSGQAGRPEKMGDGTYHYVLRAQRGPVLFKAYTSIATPTALSMIAEDEQAQKDAEIERLRARVAELEALEANGFSRPADDDTQAVVGRVEAHAGQLLSGIAEDGHTLGAPGTPTEQGLVDETAKDPIPGSYSEIA
jgi:hypothetical protein